jgi:hypothetical protein
VSVSLKGGLQFSASVAEGTLDPADLGDKFLRLTRAALGDQRAMALFERLQHLEDEPSLDWLGAES